MRLAILIFLLSLSLLSAPSRAEEGPGDFRFAHEKFHESYNRLLVEINDGLEPGDTNYRKEDFKSTYQKVYNGGKCHCRSGYCRPTIFRVTELGSAVGYDILVDGTWIPIPADSLQNERTLSRELMASLFPGDVQAHVCAYPNEMEPYGHLIECAIIPLGN